MVHDALANGQADARTRYISTVQTFEHPKDLVVIFGCNPDAIVFYRKDPAIVALFGRDIDLRAPFFCTILQRIANQILKQLHDVSGLSYYSG